jgi:hypothetical protein
MVMADGILEISQVQIEDSLENKKELNQRHPEEIDLLNHLY